MMRQWLTIPRRPGFTGTLRPLRFEGDIHDLEIEGRGAAAAERHLSSGASGCAISANVRQRPILQRRRHDRAVPLSRRQIDFKSRYAQTDKWKLERAAEHALFGAYRNPLTDDALGARADPRYGQHQRHRARRKLFALKEDSPALLMDPLTLDTIGYTDFGGKMQGQDLLRASENRSASRQHVRVRLRGQGIADPRLPLHGNQPERESCSRKPFSRRPTTA
jgi:hypothetical protein